MIPMRVRAREVRGRSLGLNLITLYKERAMKGYSLEFEKKGVGLSHKIQDKRLT